MPLAILAALILLAAPGQAPAGIDARIASSAAQAQALQGPLDGDWTLSGDPQGAIFAVEIVDPPTAGHRLEAAWRRVDGQGMGPGRVTLLGPRALEITFSPPRESVRLRLRRQGPALWTGPWPGSQSRAVLARPTR
jgi:hypothetical protein